MKQILIILKGVLDGNRSGGVHVLAAVNRIQPLVHIFGHIHEGYDCSPFFFFFISYFL